MESRAATDRAIPPLTKSLKDFGDSTHILVGNDSVQIRFMERSLKCTSVYIKEVHDEDVYEHHLIVTPHPPDLSSGAPAQVWSIDPLTSGSVGMSFLVKFASSMVGKKLSDTDIFEIETLLLEGGIHDLSSAIANAALFAGAKPAQATITTLTGWKYREWGWSIFSALLAANAYCGVGDTSYVQKAHL